MLGKKYDAAYQKGFEDGFSEALKAMREVMTRTDRENVEGSLKWEPMTGGKADEVQRTY